MKWVQSVVANVKSHAGAKGTLTLTLTLTLLRNLTLTLTLLRKGTEMAWRRTKFFFTADIQVEWLITFLRKKPGGAVGLPRRCFGDVDPLVILTVTGVALAKQFAVVEVQRGNVEDLAEVEAQYLVLGDASPMPPTNVVLTVVSDAELGVSCPPPPVQSGGQPVRRFTRPWSFQRSLTLRPTRCST